MIQRDQLGGCYQHPPNPRDRLAQEPSLLSRSEFLYFPVRDSPRLAVRQSSHSEAWSSSHFALPSEWVRSPHPIVAAPTYLVNIYSHVFLDIDRINGMR